jgi:hypothetical protein
MKEKMTISDYFKKAKADGYEWADKAMEYREDYLVGCPDIVYVDSLLDALDQGFGWNETLEKSTYWHRIYQSLVTKPTKLTKKMFEQRGWKFLQKFRETNSFSKGNPWLGRGSGALLDVTGNEIIIQTSNGVYERDFAEYNVKFYGVCQTIEEFDMICEMINLKA